jgi:Chaperone of endosialidase
MNSVENVKGKFSFRYARHVFWRSGALVPLLVVCAISAAFAVDPPPGGGYPNQNTAEGQDALFDLSTGADDTAIGFDALYNNTTGTANTAVGNLAMSDNTTGFSNTAVGSQALLGNTTGTYNVAMGENAMVANSTGGDNVAIGYTALQARTNAFDNVGIGFGALSLGTTGDSNTAVGHSAMAFSTGIQNTALGDSAMNSASGNFNVAVGRAAGVNFSGDENIVIGHYAGQNLTTGSNNIEIGNQGVAHDANVIRLGDPATQRKTFIAGISRTAVAGGVAVMVTNQGQLGVATSAGRYKENIQPMDKSSEAVLSLKPVTFRYEKELDPEAIPQFGLVAEDVAKVNPDLVVRDEDGKPYTVRYEAVNAMLLNEFLKEHKAFLEEQRKVQELEANAARQQERIESLAAGLQKVTDQLELSKPAPRTVLNNQ